MMMYASDIFGSADEDIADVCGAHPTKMRFSRSRIVDAMSITGDPCCVVDVRFWFPSRGNQNCESAESWLQVGSVHPGRW